jgi:hypothetical protein
LGGYLDWSDWSEHVPIWSNLWNVLPPSLLRIRGWTQKSWGARAGDILGWPLSHLAIICQGSEKRSSTAERSFRAPQCGCSATWPLIICLLWLLWDGHQKLPSIQRDFRACFGSSMAGCDKVLPPFMICVLCETRRVFDHSSKAYAVSKIPVSPATEAWDLPGISRIILHDHGKAALKLNGQRYQRR